MSGDPLNFLTAGSDGGGDDDGATGNDSSAISGADASLMMSGGGGGSSTGVDGDESAATSEGGFVIGGEEKKPLNKTTLILFLAVALGGGGLYLMHLRAGPDAAMAAASNSKEQQAVTTFLNGGADNMKKMQSLLQNTERVVQQFLAYPSIKQVPLNSLQTNPFREKVSAGDPNSLSEAEARRQRELAKEQIKRELDNLSLQSVMRGRVNSCMISGKLVREGQTINGFLVEKISASSVIVSQGDFKFELKMER
jgi:hypothetical protein